VNRVEPSAGYCTEKHENVAPGSASARACEKEKSRVEWCVETTEHVDCCRPSTSGTGAGPSSFETVTVVGGVVSCEPWSCQS
jgi:hypothetical protein